MKTILILLLVIMSTTVVGQEVDYDSTQRFKKGLKYAVKGKCLGLINKEGEIVLPVEYDDIDRCKEGYVFIFKDGGRGVFSLVDGKIIVPTVYGDIDVFKRDGESFFRAYGKNRIVLEYSLNGEIVKKGTYNCCVANVN